MIAVCSELCLYILQELHRETS